MEFLLLSLFAVMLPFIVERFYFHRKFGPFAILFWLFLLQVGILFGGEALLESSLDIWAPPLIVEIGKVVGAVVLLTIGFTPIAAVALSALVLLLIVFEKASNRPGGV